MSPDHPLAIRYVDTLRQALGELAPAERAEILAEIRHHISDAIAAGTPVEDVLRALGPADQLARGYQVELLLNPKTPAPRADRWLRIVGLLALGSLPTFIIVVVLASVGVSLSASGIIVFVAGIVSATGDLPPWVNMDVPSWVAMVLGPVVTGVGVLAIWGLIAYLKLLVRVVRRVVPARQVA